MPLQWTKCDLRPDKVLLRYFNGNIGLDQIIDSWKQLLQSDLLNDNIEGVINFLDGCHLEMSPEKLPVLLDFVSNYPEITRLKIGVVSNDPGTIVFPMMGEMFRKDLKIKAFSTKEAATSWILGYTD